MATKQQSHLPVGEGVPRLRDVSLSGWKRVFLTTFKEIGNDHIPIVAAGVAFFFFLALFPALAAAVSIYGLVQDPAEVEQQLSSVRQVVPEEAYGIVSSTLEDKASETGGTLGWSAMIAIFLGLWSSKKGVNAVFQGINVAYREREKRGFLKNNLLTLGFTLGGTLFGLIALALVAVFPALLGKVGFPEEWKTGAMVIRWFLLVILALIGLAAIFRVAPERESPKFRWITPGSLIATLLWVLGSMLFSWYVGQFGNYDKTYGSFAAVIILMLWFFLSAFIILFGAEINAHLEKQAHEEVASGSSAA